MTRTFTSLALFAVLVLAPWPGVAGAGTPIKTGTYRGKTMQASVSSGYRTLQFTVKKGRVTLTTEPTVARGLCLSTPVFTLDGPVSKKLSGSRTFTFTHTFIGNKFDRIHGTFVSSDEIDGYAIYHFPQQDLCSAGKVKVDFTAKHK